MLRSWPRLSVQSVTRSSLARRSWRLVVHGAEECSSAISTLLPIGVSKGEADDRFSAADRRAGSRSVTPGSPSGLASVGVKMEPGAEAFRYFPRVRQLSMPDNHHAV